MWYFLLVCFRNIKIMHKPKLLNHAWPIDVKAYKRLPHVALLSKIFAISLSHLTQRKCFCPTFCKTDLNWNSISLSFSKLSFCFIYYSIVEICEWLLILNKSYFGSCRIYLYSIFFKKLNFTFIFFTHLFNLLGASSHISKLLGYEKDEKQIKTKFLLSWSLQSNYWMYLSATNLIIGFFSSLILFRCFIIVLGNSQSVSLLQYYNYVDFIPFLKKAF